MSEYTTKRNEADELRAWFENHSVYDEFPVGYIMGLIDEQPTVDAIPIEYMQSQVDCGKWQEIIQRWKEHEQTN